jgi:hypothetical protein
MKCEECQALVEEYFDRELDQHTAVAVSVHVENCSPCSAVLEQLTFEYRAYQRYDSELDVSPALWVKVRGRLAEEKSRQTFTRFRRSQIEFSKLLSLRFSVAVSLALVLFAVLVTVAVMKYLNRQEPSKQIALSSGTLPGEKRPPGPTVVVNEPVKSKGAEGRREGPELKKGMAAGPGAESARGRSLPVRRDAREPKTPVQLVREAEKKYLSAIALLTRDAEQRPSRLDSGTRAKLDGALAAIDRTILSTRKAVQRNPNDPLAVQYMLGAYGKKVDVLKEMNSYQ